MGFICSVLTCPTRSCGVMWLLSDTLYMTNDFIAHSRPKTKRSRICRAVLYAGPSFYLFSRPLHKIFFSLLFTSPPRYTTSTRVQVDSALRDCATSSFFISPFSSSYFSPNYIAIGERATGFLHRARIVSAIIP